MERKVIMEAGKYPVVQMTIQEKTEAGIDAIVGLKDSEDFLYTSIQRAFVLKGAMGSGKASVTLYAKLKDGTHIALETSATMLKQIADLAASFR